MSDYDRLREAFDLAGVEYEEVDDDTIRTDAEAEGWEWLTLSDYAAEMGILGENDKWRAGFRALRTPSEDLWLFDPAGAYLGVKPASGALFIPANTSATT